MGVSNISSYFTGMWGGFVMSVIAFSIVFVVTAGLMLLMMTLKHFAATLDSNAEKKKNEQQPTPPAASAPTQPAAASSRAPGDDELIAVITAAIAATCGAGARIMSFAPAAPRSQGSVWKMTGRLQNSEGFAD